MGSIEKQLERMGKVFPERLSEAVSKSGKAVKQIASETGIHYNTLLSYMRGDRNPTMRSIVLLCAYLEVGSDWLLGLDAKC